MEQLWVTVTVPAILALGWGKPSGAAGDLHHQGAGIWSELWGLHTDSCHAYQDHIHKTTHHWKGEERDNISHLSPSCSSSCFHDIVSLLKSCLLINFFYHSLTHTFFLFYPSCQTACVFMWSELSGWKTVQPSREGTTSPSLSIWWWTLTLTPPPSLSRYTTEGEREAHYCSHTSWNNHQLQNMIPLLTLVYSWFYWLI